MYSAGCGYVTLKESSVIPMIKNSLTKTDLTLADFSYELPQELIAQTPLYPRDSSRLLVVKRDGTNEHRIFRDITDYLRPEDVLVINDTRVLPARIFGKRVYCAAAARSGDVTSGVGDVELLLLKQRELDTWECLAGPGKRAAVGDILEFGGILKAEVLEIIDGGCRVVHFTTSADTVYEALHKVGVMPLPPYITEKLTDSERYQTVYSRTEGSAAAPTAGLHFTEELLGKITASGTAIAPVLLHVGLGTFRPVKENDIMMHKMHSELITISEKSAKLINERKAAGGRVIAVGTTSCRALESAADDSGILHPMTDDTEIFIYPGYKFKIVDSLITNFHLPESTLLMLVSALAGRERILDVYREAVEMKYRFFSFGDAMIIC